MIRPIVITALIVGTLTAAVPSALALRGGNGGSDVGSPAWVSASPNPATAGGSRVGLTGCGYDVKPVEVQITSSAGYTHRMAVGVWNTGCFSTHFYTAEAGTYTIEVYQDQRNVRKPMLLEASTTLAVE